MAPVQGWANYGQPALAETPPYVEFYETFTIFITTHDFMKIVYASVLTTTVEIALYVPSVKHKNCL